MPPTRQQNGGKGSQHLTNGSGGGGSNDLQTRAGFTSAIVAALKELEIKKASDCKDLGQRAYQKLQYDLPLVSPEELEGLTDTLRSSLQLKSGQPLLPITWKLLENVIAGARAPVPVGATPLSLQSQSLSSAVDGRSGQPGDGAAGEVTGSALPLAAGEGAAPPLGSGVSEGADGAAVRQAAGFATQEPPPSSLMDTGLLNPDRARLCGAFRSLCAVIFVQLVSHALAVSEQDTWGLLYGIGDDEREGADSREGGSVGPAAAEPGSSARLDHVSISTEQLQNRRESHREQQQQQAHSNGCAATGPDAGEGPAPTDFGRDPDPSECTDNGRAGQPPAESPQPQRVYEEPQAAEEDGDDFVFEDLEAPCSSSSATTVAADMAAAAAGSGGCVPSNPSAPPPPPPYSWPALRARLLRLSGHVSYGLLDEPDLWRDGELLQGVFRLLRALGAHRHCQELQPLLHAYVGLVADRIAAEPSELACLDNLWDAVGLHCVASLPPMGRQRAAVGAAARGDQGQGQGLLLAEATTCLSLAASLAGQLTGASAKLRLWQQIHKHMLPLLERCLGELARAVGPGPGQAAAKAAAQQKQQPQKQQAKAPGPEEVAAIVLVCQVLDFYVQQRPGNADLAASLKGTGVLASLSVLFSAAADLTGAEPLRSAALCCAASSRELHTWMVAVPGLAKALAGPSFQEGGTYEAHGAVWELLGSSGSSPLALGILAGGAAPEKAVRVHALLQLLAKAAACRGGRGAGLWGPAVERSMRELFAALRQEQAGGATSGAGRVEGSTAAAATEPGTQRDVAAAAAAAAVVVEEEDDDDDDDKLHLLDSEALQRRRARQLHPVCWRILKQLLTASGESSGKTD